MGGLKIGPAPWPAAEARDRAATCGGPRKGLGPLPAGSSHRPRGRFIGCRPGALTASEPDWESLALTKS